MKKLWTFISCLLIGGIIPMQSVGQMNYYFEGHVYDHISYQPVSDQVVMLGNADSTYFDITYTNDSGYYSMVVSMDSVPDVIYLATIDCQDSVVLYTFGSPENYNTHDFFICTENIECHAFYTYYPEQPIDPLTLQFEDWSVSATSWFWDFGDGTSSSEQHPVHTFSEVGSYMVCLSIFDSIEGCQDMYCEEIYFGGAGCQADFYYFADSTNTLSVQFVDNSTGQVDVWYWDFGDGEDSYSQSPKHLFETSGLFHVCLHIFGNNGLCVDSICQEVMVTSDTSVCTAYFEASLDTLNNTPYVYEFANQSNGNLLSYFWDFGDGTTSIEAQPTHIYAQGGSYQVCLQVNGLEGCVDVFCTAIQTPEYYDFGGQAFMGNFPINIEAGDSSNMGTAYLYRKINNSWHFMDQREFWEFGYYFFLQKPAGEYLIRLEFSEDSDDYPDYVPSYYTHATDWKKATIFNLSDSLQFAVNVHFQELYPLPPGTGQINGSVAADNSCFAEPLLLEDGALVVLYNADQQVVAFTRADAFGFFSFSGIGMGTYSVKAEYTGLYCPDLTFVLDETNTTLAGAELMVYCAHPLNVSEYGSVTNTFEISALFPNPASDLVTLEIISKSGFKGVCTLFGSQGASVLQKYVEIVPGEQQLSVATQGFATGLYMLRFRDTESGWEISKKILIKN